MSRRVRGEGSIYRRKDGLYSGQIDVGWHAGKRRRRTVYGKTEEAVARKMRAARQEIDAGNLNTSSVAVADWIRYWLEEIAAKKLKPRTLATYRSYAEGHIIPALGRKKLDRLTPAHVRELHAAMASADARRRKQKTAAGLSTTSARQAHRILSGALKAAMREGKVARNVASASFVDIPAKAASTRTGLTAAQARAVMTAATGVPGTSRWWAALLTGARQGECLGLRWDYVDLDAGTADLAWSLQRVAYSHSCADRRPAPGKPWPCGRRYGADCPTRAVRVPAGMEHERLDGNLCLLRPKTAGSRRVVPLLPAMAAALRLERDRDAGPNPHGLVWHRRDGRPHDPKEDWAAWRALLVAAKVPAVTLHEARNTVATLLLEAGVDPHVISSMLGHSSVVTTRGYMRVGLELKRRAVAGLGETLGLPAGDGGSADSGLAPQ